MQKKLAKKILHITPHLGGGVGKVLLNYLSKVNDDPTSIQEVVCLDYANPYAIKVARKLGFSLHDKMYGKKRELFELIANSDIVLIHWWNHPLLFDFLVREQLPENRMIMWSHISGFHSPNVFSKKILKYPDLFIFTTPLSYKTNEVQNLSDEDKKSLRVIWSTGGVDHVKSVKPEKHNGFNIGYIGTVNYAKMHPDFLKICNNIDIPDVKFIICGGSKEKQLKKEAEKLGISEKFIFTGPVEDINKYLSIFDIFGYPLAPFHYGTCDQVLQESMAAGVVPVVFSNPMESYMVKDGLTGIVAQSEDDYINAIQKLYRNHDLKSDLSHNAKKHAISAFSLDKIVNCWNIIFNEVLMFPKTIKKWKNNKNDSDITHKDVFLESLGDYGEDFNFYYNAKSDEEKSNAIKKLKKLAESPSWKAKTKGTVHHYSYFFPDDRNLLIWSRLMKKKE